MKIKELQPRQSNVDIEAEVIDKGPVREFSKFGRSGKVCTIQIQDETGKVKMSLWNEDAERINLGDTLKLTGGYVNEYQGEMQLTTGRGGKVEVVPGAAKPATLETITEPKPEVPKAVAKPAPIKEPSRPAPKPPAQKPAPKPAAKSTKASPKPTPAHTGTDDELDGDIDIEEEYID